MTGNPLYEQNRGLSCATRLRPKFVDHMVDGQDMLPFAEQGSLRSLHN